MVSDMAENFIYLLVISLLICNTLGQRGGKTCGENEIFQKPTKCEPTCSNPEPQGCTLNMPFCTCKPGFVRHVGKCIKLQECPCSDPNEEMVESPNQCPGGTCQQPGYSSCTTSRPAWGCQCKTGYLRNAKGLCIPTSECPTMNFNKNCKANEIWMFRRTCEPTCTDAEPTTCDNKNTKFCTCKTGFVRHQGKCISKDECPDIDEDDECDDNEILKKRWDCEPTCVDDVPTNCDKKGTRYCTCKDGYVRHLGNCILKDKCPTKPVRCGLNEILKKRTDCEPTCVEDKLTNCDKKDTRYCTCKAGFIRNEGKCIPKNECPSDTVTCGLNEIFKKRTDCEPTCVIDKLTNCDKKGTQYCTCKEGFVRHEGNCISKDKCPTTTVTCGLNEIFKKRTDCEPTCVEDKLTNCDKKGTQYCTCKDDFVRHEGNCISKNKCPTTTVTCGLNEIFKKRTDCEPTCVEDKLTNCDKKGTQYCTCKDGFVRHEGNCISKDKCPKVCGNNEVFTKCLSDCSATCPGMDGKATTTCKPSTGKCVAGCECKDGYLKNPQGKCVLPADCPPFTCSDANAEYSMCGDKCIKTCANQVRGETVVCTTGCNPSCVCKSGFIKDDDGKCILPKFCKIEECDTNEVFDTCVPNCEDTCRKYWRKRWGKKSDSDGEDDEDDKNNDDEDERPGCKGCKPGCRCIDGYVRNRKGGKCIKVNECKRFKGRHSKSK